ncbi:MAG: branched-chain amino acid aminotransferase [Cyclobacteriaceae bacterium]|jgi:branched-chain amino acid aminotransferase|nr:branched-chain amino acid aminotransferase [Flammeovirgaceae bacterium]MCZ8020344.1 branched-chain amino acid aminotransferase [Cytophagales bacterium]MCZ8327189.1 branched-chain amino acid aminotransferase [Cyclobacteriaceae bacterium]
MVITDKISIQKTGASRLNQVDFSNIPFGKIYTDHMFLADYKNGAWSNQRIIPYGYMPISPATPALHYGQSIFEGMKAIRNDKDEVLIFRPYDNWQRLNKSGYRMCMPHLPEEIFVEGLRTLLDLDKNWIPKTEGSSLYIRPFMYSADEYIGIRPSENFTFQIILCPVGAYYSTPVKVKVETHYTRAVAGGTGYAKAGGNYGGAIYPAKLAQDRGYHQLIWTDGIEHKYIEESGTMNVMFVINNKLVTPALSDSILAGITRDSVLKLAKHLGIQTEERKISVQELREGLENGSVTEAFGAGTAATIAHIELVGFDDKDIYLPPIENRKISNLIYKELDAIKRGNAPDPFMWLAKW